MAEAEDDRGKLYIVQCLGVPNKFAIGYTTGNVAQVNDIFHLGLYDTHVVDLIPHHDAKTLVRRVLETLDQHRLLDIYDRTKSQWVGCDLAVICAAIATISQSLPIDLPFRCVMCDANFRTEDEIEKHYLVCQTTLREFIARHQNTLREVERLMSDVDSFDGNISDLLEYKRDYLNDQ